MIETASEILASELLECLARLPEDRIRCARRVGELMDEGRQGFVDEVVQIVCRRAVPPESEHALLSLLIAKGYLLPVLHGIYAFDRMRFREVLSMVRAVEPKLHTRLTKRLLELLAQEQVDRVEEVLCLFDSVVQLNGMANLGVVLSPLKEAKDPRLRAKAALLSSSLPNGRHLLELYRDEMDPRVRAGIVESLWLDDQPIARIVFEEARRDPQPRVRSHGLLGLYHLGDPRALSSLAEMADSSQALSRAVARTAIELLDEPRLEPMLAKLRMEFGDSPVKHEPVSPAAKYGRRPIHLAIARALRLPSGRFSVQLSARLNGDEPLHPELRPLDLRAWVDGQPVLRYSMSRIAPSGRIGVGVILPCSSRAAAESTPGIRGVLNLLMSMPEGDLRSAGFYRSGLFTRQLEPDGVEGPPPSTDTDSTCNYLPVISAEEFGFAKDVKSASREENLAEEPGEMALGMLNRLKALKAAGHVGVVVNEAVKGPPGIRVMERLREGFQVSGCSLHLIALGQVDPENLAPWRLLSRDSGGFEARISTEDELPGVVHHWMLCFRECYDVEFDVDAPASGIRIQAVHPSGVGEITFPIEKDPSARVTS